MSETLHTNESPMKIVRHEVKLDTVLRYFAKDFDADDGKKLEYDKAFVDTASGIVVFRMWESNK